MVPTPEPGEPRLRAALGSVRPELTQQDRWRTAFVMALYAGDMDRAITVLREAVSDIPAVTVLDDVLAPAMRDIGALWERDEISAADEHLATFLTHRLLAEVSPALQVERAADRNTVLLATSPPERHFTGLLMAHDVLQGARYTVVFLGSGVPLRDLASALKRHRPALVGLSVTMPFLAELTETIDCVLDTLPSSQVFVGGAGAAAMTPRTNVHRVDRLADLLGAAERLLAAQRR